MPGPTAASTRGFGSKAKLKMNATSMANTSTDATASRVRASPRRSLR